MVFFQERAVRRSCWFTGGVDLVHGCCLTRLIYTRQGIQFFLVDLRYRGESEGDHSTFGAMETKDVEAAVQYLFTRSDVGPGAHWYSKGLP